MTEDMEVVVKDVLARILEQGCVNTRLADLHRGIGTRTPSRVWLDAEKLLEHLRDQDRRPSIADYDFEDLADNPKRQGGARG
jgi:hypothetical protein